MLTLDVKGAFDAVLLGRFVRRMREQGWPEYLAKWLTSFATNRTVQIRLDGETTPPQKVNCGLPQGSPISPILFMLYVAPILKMGSTSRKFGYVNDVALIETQKSLQENSVALGKSLKEVLEWGQAEGITFDPGKSELQYFSRCRANKDPNSTPTIPHRNFSVSEGTIRPYTTFRWLGIYFDKTYLSNGTSEF
ncbi:hypothetical protein K3495_g8891 [Podosphaera aphanis]|nr:hypothetical protein K3495_g8891 [Podosphaera aphanis]